MLRLQLILKDPKIGSKMINARAETVAESSFFALPSATGAAWFWQMGSTSGSERKVQQPYHTDARWTTLCLCRTVGALARLDGSVIDSAPT